MSVRWIAELRAGRSVLALVALLAAVTAGAAAAVPAEMDASDSATVSAVAGQALHTQRNVVLTRSVPAGDPTVEDGPALRAVGDASRSSLPPAVGALTTGTRITAVKEFALRLLDPPAGVTMPVHARPVAMVGYQNSVSFVAGAAPAAPGPPPTGFGQIGGVQGNPQPPVGSPGQPAGAPRPLPVWQVPVALSKSVADTLGLRVGDKVHAPVVLVPEAPVVELVVSGIFVPAGPADDPVWGFTPDALGAVHTRACDPPRNDCDSPVDVWMLDVVVADPSVVSVLGQASADTVVVTVEHVVDQDRLAHSDLSAVGAGMQDLQRFGTGATPKDPTGQPYPMQLWTGLPKLIAQAEADQRAGHALDALVLGGTVAGALAAFLLMLRMAVARRSAEIALCKARGASSWRLAARFAVQTGAVVAAAGAVGVAVALKTGPTPTARHASESWYGAVLATVVSVGIVLVLVRRHTDRVPSQRRERLGGEARARLAVRDAGLLLGAVGALAFLRSQGLDSASGGIDWVAVAAPALLAFSAGIITVRLVPPLLAGPAFAARARRAAVGFVATVLAVRRVRAVAAPLTGLAVVIAAGMFAAGYDAAVPQQVRNEALRTAGSAARITAGQLTSAPGAAVPAFAPEFTAAASRVRGVTGVATAWVGPGNMDPGACPTGRRWR
ncbi:hypothetical protein ACFQ9X_41865 [Catenulispora yoronensis]